MIIEKAEAKRDAYIAAGYDCSELVIDGGLCHFTARDSYGRTRQHVFGEKVDAVKEKLPEIKSDKREAKVLTAEEKAEELIPVAVKTTKKKKGSK